MCGKHPTQKPLSLLTRIVLASTKEGQWVLYPFAGSSTTGIAANLAGRRFLGIEQEHVFLELSKRRRQEIEHINVVEALKKKIKDFALIDDSTTACEAAETYRDLPF